MNMCWVLEKKKIAQHDHNIYYILVVMVLSNYSVVLVWYDCSMIVSQ